MPNPWNDLPEKDPYVLTSDRDAITQFNKCYTKESPYHIQTQLLPEPFIGTPSANVYLLSLNPGYDPRDDEWHSNRLFKKATRSNLTHTPDNSPFYYLDDRFVNSPGATWWRGKLASLIQSVGTECVSKQVMCIELFPYHSTKYRAIPARMRGHAVDVAQKYALSLVKKAMLSDKTIILMRHRRGWEDLLPDLCQYGQYYRIANPREPRISVGNLGDNYDRVVEALKA